MKSDKSKSSSPSMRSQFFKMFHKFTNKPNKTQQSSTSSTFKKPLNTNGTSYPELKCLRTYDKCNCETQTSSHDPFGDFPESITIRLSPLHCDIHKKVLLLGLVPRLEFNCLLISSLREVFQRLESHFEKLFLNKGNYNFYIGINTGVDEEFYTWRKHDPMLIKELYLISKRPKYLQLYYYWDEPEKIRGKRSSSEQYEGMVQFLTNIVSGVVGELKEKNKKLKKSEVESINANPPIEEIKEIQKVEKDEEEIDLQKPFKKLFEKSNHVGNYLINIR